MAVESVHSQVYRETPIQPKLENPEIIEQLRHGNIFEVLRSQISAEDFNKFINYRGRLFESSILQNYSVYSDYGTVPPPQLDALAPQDIEMAMTSDEREFFKQEMARVQAFEPVVKGEKVHLQAKAIGYGSDQELSKGPGEDILTIGEKALGEWEEFFTELQWKVIDAQMVQQMRAKKEELDRETQRMISLVMSRQIDPEYVIIAATKANMAQNGILFSWKGKRIMHLNEQMNSYAKELHTMDPNAQGYFKELQMSQSRTRSASTQMQMELMDIQKFAQNAATSLEFANNAVRTFAQMRQPLTQAIRASMG